MRESLFQSGRGKADTLVISPYPLIGDDRNTGPRYQLEAEATGFDILGITKTGTNTLRFSPALRRAVSARARFDELCATEASQLTKYTEGYDTVIVRGQSTGGFSALGMVKSQQFRTTHLLMEDGINLLSKPNGKRVNAAAARIAWYRFAKEEKLKATRPLDWEAPPSRAVPLTKADQLVQAGQFIVETVHFSNLWRSSYGEKTILEIISAQPGLAVLCKFLGHAVTAPAAESQFFGRILEIAGELRDLSPEPHASVKQEFIAEGWHNWLTYPEFGAANLCQAAAMESFVDKQ